MKQFCNEFWRCLCQYPRAGQPKNENHDIEACTQCKEAWEEARRDMNIPCVTRSELEQAALDCHGQP